MLTESSFKDGASAPFAESASRPLIDTKLDGLRGSIADLSDRDEAVSKFILSRGLARVHKEIARTRQVVLWLRASLSWKRLARTSGFLFDPSSINMRVAGNFQLCAAPAP